MGGILRDIRDSFQLIARTPGNIALVVLGATVLSTLPPQVSAQTCSCASVPILGSMELASPQDQQWFLATSYEYHDISDLVSGSDSIPDTTGRDRTSEAMIFEASRGLTDKWSISALLAAVSHEREVNNIRASASGLGDALLLAKYSPQTISLYSNTTWSLGFGARIPLGSDDETQNGITLAEDMQPSVGAYGGILWGYWAHALNDSKSARIYAAASYTQNGENDRDYQFGTETTATFGSSYQTQSPWGFGLELVYRTSERDQRDSTDIPNTGGEWLDIVPSAQYHVTETLAISASGKFPLARDLNDALQFTTKYSFRLSLSYIFGAEKG